MHSEFPDARCSVYVAQTRCLGDRSLRARLESLLDRDELARQSRLRTDFLRARFALGHGVLRSTLAEFVAIAPDRLRFVADDKGRLSLAEPHASTGVDFNLSYTTDLVVCAVSMQTRIGVDVEHHGRLDPSELTHHALSPDEREQMRRLSATMAKSLFYRVWVLKEAYSKAVGIGLGMDFNAIRLLPRPDGAIDCMLAAEDRPGDWQFVLFDSDAGHHLAVAAQAAASLSVDIHACYSDAEASLRWTRVAAHPDPVRWAENPGPARAP